MNVSNKDYDVIEGVSCIEEIFHDGSAWSLKAEFNKKSVIVAIYVAGVVSFYSPPLKNGRPSVCATHLVKWFEKKVELKMQKIPPEWLFMHKCLYQL